MQLEIYTMSECVRLTLTGKKKKEESNQELKPHVWEFIVT